MAAEVVERGRISEAAEALLKWSARRGEQGRLRLLEEDQLVYLVVSLKRIPEKGRRQPFLIELPHPLIDESKEVCLIVNDRSRGILRSEAKQRVLQEGLRVAKVLGVSKLKSNYSTHESRRKLCGSYDLFLVDRCLVQSMPKLLGKVFYKKKKHPVPVDLTKSQWKPQLEKVFRSAFFYLRTGSCSTIKVGRLSQTKEEIVDNIMAVVEGAADLIPRKWENILALHLKAHESPCLPLYQKTPVLTTKSIVAKPAVEIVKLEQVAEANEAEDRIQQDESGSDADEQKQQQKMKKVSAKLTRSAVGAKAKTMKPTAAATKVKKPKSLAVKSRKLLMFPQAQLNSVRSSVSIGGLSKGLKICSQSQCLVSPAKLKSIDGASRRLDSLERSRRDSRGCR